MTDIKVGDTVRILPSAPRASTAHMGVGKEFVVTQLLSTSVYGGATPNYAMGEEDFARMGVFLEDLEKVEADPRWRYNDHIVVYPETRDSGYSYGNHTLGRGVTILDETPLPKIYTRWENRPEAEGDEITEAARAYWEAHPENVPAWYSANPGEVWVLGLNDDEVAAEAGFSDGGLVFWIITGKSGSAPQFSPTEFTAGRRIYPEPTE